MSTKQPVSEYPAHLYAAVHDGNAGDVEFYRQRCAGAESVLELGCGDARVLAIRKHELEQIALVLPGMERKLRESAA